MTSLRMSDALATAGGLGLQYMELYDVRRYGARGDGVHDDGPALQAAITAANAAGGGIVALWPGTYLDASVTLMHLPNVILLGLGGRGGVTIRAANGLNKTLLQFPGGAGPYSNAQIRNITFDQNGSNQTATTQLQFNRVTDFLMEQCTVINPWDIALRFADASSGPYENIRPVLRDCLFDGAGQLHPVDLVDFGSSQDARVEHCAFINCAASANGALSSAYTSGLLVDACIFRGNANWALSIQGADGARVRGCRFVGNVGQGAIQATPWTTSAPHQPLTDLLVEGCWFSGNTIGVLVDGDGGDLPDHITIAACQFESQVTAHLQVKFANRIRVLGGSMDSSATAVSLPNGAIPLLRISDVEGLNPLGGAVVTPAYPAASGSVQNTTGYDCMYILTANGATGNTASTISDATGAHTVTVGASSGLVIPAGATYKAGAYTGGPPTWAWYAL